MCQPAENSVPTPVLSGPPAHNPLWSWVLAWMAELCALAARIPRGETISPHECARWHPAIDPAEVESHLPLDELYEFVLERHREHCAIVGNPTAANPRDASMAKAVDLVARLVGVLDHEAQRLLGIVLADALTSEHWRGFGPNLDDPGSAHPVRTSAPGAT